MQGDKAYTKVQKNLPPHESAGWIILFIDRASRFMWALDCGENDQQLFEQTIKTLATMASQTDDLRRFTDGERRYGRFLFEICHELVKTGQRGRPKNTLKRGIQVRIKTKGFQKHQNPWAEHPETRGRIEASDIPANHAEAFFSSRRRKCSAFRRKTKRSAKVTKGLQRLLHVYWVVHNLIRVHFTTPKVPDVALGVILRPLSVDEIFRIRIG